LPIPNIYISALLFGGPCEAILGLARVGLLDLYDSPAIEREFCVRNFAGLTGKLVMPCWNCA
jgi:hypothetical protein